MPSSPPESPHPGRGDSMDDMDLIFALDGDVVFEEAEDPAPTASDPCVHGGNAFGQMLMHQGASIPALPGSRGMHRRSRPSFRAQYFPPISEESESGAQ